MGYLRTLIETNQTMIADPKQLLKDITPRHEFFIGIDSDGCAFDTMETKQKEFFIPEALKLFNLFPASSLVRQTWEFVNLYSVDRGTNRFIALVKTFDLLKERQEFKDRKVALPDLSALREWIKVESRLGNPALEEYIKQHPHPVLSLVLEWSKTVNREIGQWMKGIEPFPFVRECIQKMQAMADVMVVSQTPLEALTREWEEHNLSQYLLCIAGQEHGTKSEHLRYAAAGKYPARHILMIGDSLNDLKAALDNRISFYPVMPGKEEKSWKYLFEEVLDLFFCEKYQGKLEDALTKNFRQALPSTPPWMK
jgi:phosphoglycolate phosphatase-like HAD superfamily hydrolase